MDGTELTGEHMRKARRFVDLSQAEAAEVMGISRNALSNYELGIRSPDAEVVKKMAMLYKCSPDFLLALTDTYKTVRYEH
jgi:transcriptional regulator with XRE-family HTH domain